MIDLGLTLLAAFGIGLPSAAIGVRLASGLFLIPVLAVLGNTVAGIPLSIVFKSIFWASLIRMAWEFKKNLRSAQKTEWIRILYHPALLIPVLYSLAYTVFVKRPFTLHQWDEFSHWALMPKQVLLFNQVSSADFPYRRFLEYTPGWPLLVDFPFFILGKSYSLDHLHFAVLAVGIAVGALIFDLTKDALTQKGIRENRAILASWAIILFTARSGLGIPIFPENILLENPLQAAFAAAVASIWILRDRRLSFLPGLTLAFGYLLKKPFVAVFPFFLWRGWRSRSVATALRDFAPWLICALVWHLVTRKYPHLFVLKSGKADLISTLLSEDSVSIAKGMFGLVGQIVRENWLLSAVDLGCFFLLARRKETRGFQLAGVAFLFFFLAGLHWLYLTTFPGREGLQLASGDRYLATAFAAWSFAVIFPAATEILVPMAEHFRLGWIVVQITALIFLLAVVEQTQHTFHLFNKYGVPSPILDEAPGLIELLKARGRRGQEITLIDEGEGKVTEYQALYASIADTGAPFFQVSSRDESDPHPLTDSQWIWPIRYGEKTATKLQQLAGDHCPGEVRNYFLIRQGSGRFECVRKAGN